LKIHTLTIKSLQSIHWKILTLTFNRSSYIYE
jgi:hypothetical protein